jgi:hypothetical protein
LEQIIQDSLGLDIPAAALPGTETFCVAVDKVVEGDTGMQQCQVEGAHCCEKNIRMYPRGHLAG